MHAALRVLRNVTGGVLTKVSDAFNRANSTTAVGTADTGQTWVTLRAGTYGINTNQAYCATGGQDGGNVCDSTVSDCTVSVTIATQATTNKARLLFRANHTTQNYYLIQAEPASSSYSCWRTTSGTSFTQLLSGIAGAPAAGDTVKAILNGNTITVQINNNATSATTDSTYATQTEHGFGVDADTSPRWDNFLVTVP